LINQAGAQGTGRAQRELWMKRFLLVAGLGAGIAAVGALAGWSLFFTADQDHAATARAAKDEHGDHSAVRVALSQQQISDAGIEVAEAKGGILRRHFLAPGSLIPDADHVARVSVRVLATVAELRKRLGDSVEKGEIVAAIESREIADAKSEYLAARLTNDLQQTLYSRQKVLVETRTVSENEFLRTRLTANDAQIKLDSARQKLFALGLSESEISELPNQPAESLRRQFLRSPIDGRISERRVDLGGLVGREGLESELFVIVNLDDLWVDLAISPEDIASVHEGAPIIVRAIGIEGDTTAEVIFVSPLLDRETRNARVIASLPNPDHRWKPGTFVTAEIPLSAQPSRVIVPRKALQSIRGTATVFVRDGEGFEARAVRTGLEDDDDIEVLSGLSAGETIAVVNTFVLKAELEKSDVEHD
jgi:cobalt-zinc-cadmium efflux system membrane fusion protein